MSTDHTITVDQSALDRLSFLREKEGLEGNVKLRIAIVGGGCSGFKYAMGLTDEVFEDDKIFADAVIVDETSLGIMKGSVVAFKDNLTGAQFVIENPNVVSGCGCGTSFSVKDEAAE